MDCWTINTNENTVRHRWPGGILCVAVETLLKIRIKKLIFFVVRINFTLFAVWERRRWNTDSRSCLVGPADIFYGNLLKKSSTGNVFLEIIYFQLLFSTSNVSDWTNDKIVVSYVKLYVNVRRDHCGWKKEILLFVSSFLKSAAFLLTLEITSHCDWLTFGKGQLYNCGSIEKYFLIRKSQKNVRKNYKREWNFKSFCFSRCCSTDPL